jgi:hypothetical protein
MMLTVPLNPAINGEHATWAAAGTASASAAPRGTRRRSNASRQCGAMRRRPAVANVDSPKPMSVAKAGS